MKKFIQKIFLSTLLLLFVLFGAISLGAIGEDYFSTASILNYILNKTLVIVLAYIAIKLPLVVLFKSALINSCCALLSWKAIINPSYLKELFTLRRKEVYYTQRKSLNYEIRKLIPVLNKNTSSEHKIRFCMNPVSIAISLINCCREYWIYMFDSLTSAVYLRTQENDTKNFFHNIIAPVNTNVSPRIFRYAKGIAVIACELATMLLKFIEPIANIPYLIIYFVSITAPDYICGMFITTNNSALAVDNGSSTHTSGNHNNSMMRGVVTRTNSRYIKEHLEETEDFPPYIRL